MLEINNDDGNDPKKKYQTKETVTCELADRRTRGFLKFLSKLLIFRSEILTSGSSDPNSPENII